VLPEGRRLGLVIGIDQYDDSAGIRRLNAAVADAQAIYAAMIDPDCGRFSAELTTLLTDHAASDSSIRIALERLRKQATPNDEVWFFFAGHALLVDGEHRLLPSNARGEYLDATSVDFPALFSKIRCRRKLVFLDCCHAGASDASTRHVHDVEEVFRSYSANGTITYCSSEGDQKSVELQEHGHGAFTYWLERGLRGEADTDGSGVVTSDELWRYVCEHVEADARRLTGRTQTPRLKADTSGAFALSINIGAVRARVSLAEQQEAARRTARAQLDADRALLRQLLGEDEHAHLSTQELKAALRVLEGDPASRTAQQLRRALEEFREQGNAEEVTLRIRGALRQPGDVPSVAPPPAAAAPRPLVPPSAGAPPAPSPALTPATVSRAPQPWRRKPVVVVALVLTIGVLGAQFFQELFGSSASNSGLTAEEASIAAAPSVVPDSAAAVPADNGPVGAEVRATYAGRQMVYTDVSVNGNGNEVLVPGGSLVQVTFNWRLDVDEGPIYCPDCIVQSYVGLNEDMQSAMLCHFSGITSVGRGDTHPGGTTFVAPTQPGRYHITQAFALGRSCDGRVGSGTAGAGTILGSIIVDQ
jgi:hypothetical protein